MNCIPCNGTGLENSYQVCLTCSGLGHDGTITLVEIPRETVVEKLKRVIKRKK